ncbi:hypothetical protein BaRGS_00003234 [Batillaria attramentaria]|uniref:Uncharacterized protein n=1 Tax=Batillaria attramentaria TaxID=370345 RepID=A0ABD0M0P4_9CAEN
MFIPTDYKYTISLLCVRPPKVNVSLKRSQQSEMLSPVDANSLASRGVVREQNIGEMCLLFSPSSTQNTQKQYGVVPASEYARRRHANESDGSDLKLTIEISGYQ